eukprot:sb/3471409/
MLRASGFGDGGSPLSVQYEKQFKTHDTETVSIPRITSGKRCFYTGTREIVGYLPTDGDWGGPIVWTSPDNFQDYQVFLMPKMPAPRATFETDQNYQMWGEWLAYYDRFIADVVTTPSSEGSTERLWGCEYKDSSEVKPPAQDPKVFETTDAPAESSDEWITLDCVSRCKGGLEHNKVQYIIPLS